MRDHKESSIILLFVWTGSFELTEKSIAIKPQAANYFEASVVFFLM